MKHTYTKDELFSIIEKFEKEYNTLPRRNDLPKVNISEQPFKRVFGTFTNAKLKYKEYSNSINGSLDNRNNKLTLIEQLQKNLSEEELRTLVKSSIGSVERVDTHYNHPKDVYTFKFLLTGDSHIGHNKFVDSWWNTMIDIATKENVDFAYHTGDILEGMSTRAGHVYELSHIGFEAQFDKAKELFKNVPFEFRAILGNHDSWYKEKSDQGINVGIRLSESLPNFTYLGTQEADDNVGGIKIKLWHGNDGASYSLSYRTQKFVEMLSSGEKPNILLAGHAHKSLFYETRNVHVFESGTLCKQSSFMRGKKLSSHTGFWIVTCYTDGKSLTRIIPEWYPFYSK